MRHISIFNIRNRSVRRSVGLLLYTVNNRMLHSALNSAAPMKEHSQHPMINLDFQMKSNCFVVVVFFCQLSMEILSMSSSPNAFANQFLNMNLLSAYCNATELEPHIVRNCTYVMRMYFEIGPSPGIDRNCRVPSMVNISPFSFNIFRYIN